MEKKKICVPCIQKSENIRKINSKWMKDWKVKHKTLKLTENSIGKNLDDLGNEFLDTLLKAKAMKELISELN